MLNGFISFFVIFVKNKILIRLLYASSSSVYADNNDAKYCEILLLFSILNQLMVKSKLSNEMHASEISKSNDISLVGLRFFSVYGPYGRPDMAYYAFTKFDKRKRNNLFKQ